MNGVPESEDPGLDLIGDRGNPLFVIHFKDGTELICHRNGTVEGSADFLRAFNGVSLFFGEVVETVLARKDDLPSVGIVRSEKPDVGSSHGLLAGIRAVFDSKNVYVGRKE